MSKYLLLLLLFLSNNGNAQVVAEPVEAFEYQYPRGFPWELKEQGPSDVLRHADVDMPSFVYTTTRVDTIQMKFKMAVQGIDTTEMFYYKPKGVREGYYMIKRESDWLRLRASTLKHVSMSTTQFKFVKLGKGTDRFLEVRVNRPEANQVRSFWGRKHIDLWKNVKTVSLFNLTTKEFYLHNVLIGYDYRYVSIKKESSDKIKSIDKAFLDYQLKINYKRGTIKIKEQANYYETLSQKNKETPISLSKTKGTCAPAQHEGKYKLIEGKFVKR